mmetsp:Transcript_11282/g.31995  ORF Transcript_11282/g.31995 Transcript_11282/m.31995 type:complete len:208 (-) Transcript_11282:2219-2842(-)
MAKPSSADCRVGTLAEPTSTRTAGGNYRSAAPSPSGLPRRRQEQTSDRKPETPRSRSDEDEIRETSLVPGELLLPHSAAGFLAAMEADLQKPKRRSSPQPRISFTEVFRVSKGEVMDIIEKVRHQCCINAYLRNPGRSCFSHTEMQRRSGASFAEFQSADGDLVAREVLRRPYIEQTHRQSRLLAVKAFQPGQSPRPDELGALDNKG